MNAGLATGTKSGLRVAFLLGGHHAADHPVMPSRILTVLTKISFR
jgi:hypothetical protein